MSDNIPSHVQQDLDSGFVMTDIDDGFQRCLQKSDTVFTYRCEVNGETYEETIDTESLDQEDAISGYYDSVDALIIECKGDMDSVNMLIAECEFENNCPMEMPK